MTIPEGNLVSYSQVAQKINKENATRAVASAIAKNPIAVLIPCHRVIQSTGIFGEYHWGEARKTALIGFEACKNQSKMKEHNYKATTKWTGNTNGIGTASYKSYKRSYEVIIADKKVIKGSSDPAFLGDKTKHNPEELFLASISSCHMLWFLHLCAKEGITVMTYIDRAEGKMIENKNGSGQIEEVVLKPKVMIKEEEKKSRINSIHEQANKMCFIANSCNFEIRHEPETRIFEEQSN